MVSLELGDASEAMLAEADTLASVTHTCPRQLWVEVVAAVHKDGASADARCQQGGPVGVLGEDAGREAIRRVVHELHSSVIVLHSLHANHWSKRFLHHQVHRVVAVANQGRLKEAALAIGILGRLAARQHLSALGHRVLNLPSQELAGVGLWQR